MANGAGGYGIRPYNYYYSSIFAEQEQDSKKERPCRNPLVGFHGSVAPHPACGHLPPRGKAFAYDKKGVTQLNTEKVISRDNDYILHTYGRSQVVLAEGEGMTARDADGKSYLDFTSGIGVNSLGYCHPAWVRAVADQAATLQHTSNLYYTAPDGKLAKKLCRRTGLDAVFFGNSGAEANEGAIKCARKYSVDTYGESRNKVITLVNSFHGRTLATLTATGQDVFHHDFGPFPENFDYVPAGDFAALEKAADKDTCAVMMELVQGEGGVVALDADYVARVAAFCREKDILVIVDEVQTGVGRTGKFLACEHFDLHPDIVTLAVLDEMDDDFLANVNERAAQLRAGLAKLPHVREVSGLGLMVGIAFDDGIKAADVRAACEKAGLLVLTAKTRLRLLPPLILTADDVDDALAILRSVLEKCV